MTWFITVNYGISCCIFTYSNVLSNNNMITYMVPCSVTVTFQLTITRYSTMLDYINMYSHSYVFSYIDITFVISCQVIFNLKST